MLEFGGGGDGLAWYQQGQWDAEQAARLRGATGTRREDAQIRTLLAQQHAQAAEIVRLRQQLADTESRLDEYRHNYDKLRLWAEDASAEIKEYRARER